MKRILLVSTLPATSGVGGVTIHTQRLLECKELVSDSYQLVFFDYKKHSIKDYIRQLRSCDAVHIHISNPKARLAFIFLAKTRGKKVILTVHGNLGRHKPVNNFFDRLAVKLSDIPILINEKSFLKGKKINSASVMVPAFIPPQSSEPLPEHVISLLEQIDRDRYKMICATNASRCNYDDNGNEIYGIYFLLKAFAKVKDAFLIISDPSGDYSNSINKESLPKNIEIINGPHSFFELLKRCDGMIRATSTDGDAISIKEALYLRRIVIATDCVDRPEGVCLFKYNDSESLLKVLNDKNFSQEEQSNRSIDSAISHLKKIYLKV